MTYYETTKKEIATIAPRTFKLNLSDADVVRIFEKAGAEDLTPEQLLENFIGDLVCGTRTNGSDERMYASQWFERCHFSEMADSTFIGYILRWGSYEMVISCLDDIAENEAEIANLSEDDEDYAEDKEYYTLLNENTRKEITDIFEHYCNSNKQHKSFDEEIGTVREYREKLKRVLGEKSDDTDNRNINRN